VTSAASLGRAEILDQLRDPGFARLFWARFVSAFGTAMAPVAMAFGVLELTGSPRLMGLVIASQTAAQVAVQLLGGAIADRFSRRRVMIVADCIAAASQAIMALLLLRGDAAVGLLMALMAVNGVAFALHWPAAVGIVPLVVPRHRLQPANALLSLAQSTAFALGGASAGVIVAVAGSGWAIGADSFTFVSSALLVARLRPGQQRFAISAGLVAQLRDGWKEFTAHRWLWAIVAQFSLVVAAWNGGMLVIGPVVADRFMGGAAAWGWVTGSLGFGFVAGGLIGMRARVHRPMRVATLCVLSMALPLWLMVSPAPLPLVAAGAFVAGAGGALFSVLWNTALHTHVAPDALSRVSAYDVLGSIALAPLGEAIAGPLAEGLGTGPALSLGVGFIVVPTLVVLCVPEVWSLRASSGAGEGAYVEAPGD
jgi:MFS family permease